MTRYHQIFDDIRLPDPTRRTIRQALAAAPCPVRRPRRRLQVGVCAAAAALLLGAGVLGSVSLGWRDEAHGQYLFRFEEDAGLLPAEALDPDFRTRTLQDAADDGGAWYAADGWQQAAELTGLPLVGSDQLDQLLAGPDAQTGVSARLDDDGRLAGVLVTGRGSQTDGAGAAYLVELTAAVRLEGADAPALPPASQLGVYDTRLETRQTPAGLTVQAAVCRIDGRVRLVDAWFTQDGVLYNLRADAWGPYQGEADIPTESVFALLDSLQPAAG